MKYLGLILVVALVAGQVLAQRINVNDRRPELFDVKRGLSNSFRNYLENFKIIMRKGNDTLGIPVLDPYKKDFYATIVNQPFLKSEIKLGDFEVMGLSQYNVRTAEVSVFYRTLTVGLTWPIVRSIGDYKINGVVYGNKPVYGEGEYAMTITNLSFNTVVSLGIWGGVSIKSMQTEVALDGFAFSITGLYGDDDTSAIVSQTISDMVPQLVRDYQRQITAAINKEIMAYGNNQLDGMSISQLWALFG